MQLTGGYKAVKVKDGASAKKHCLNFPETMARSNLLSRRSEGSQISLLVKSLILLLHLERTDIQDVGRKRRTGFGR